MIGSGKTTLLAAWSAIAKVPVRWCVPRAGKLPIVDIEQFAASGPCTLVIDCGEQVADEEFEPLGRIIDRYPRLRVIVASRTSRTARELAANSDSSIEIMRPQELLITADELRGAVADEHYAVALEALDKFGGLAIAVRAALDETRLGYSGAPERLLRRLRAEFSREETYQADLRLVLLPRVDDSILDAWGVSEHVVHELDQTGIVQREGIWLNLHPYVHDVFADEAERMVPADERHALIRLAVRSSLLQHDPLEALRAAFTLDDPGLATEVVLANMVELLEIRDETYAVFRGVPASRLRGYPALVVMLVLLSNMKPETRPRAIRLLAVESLFQRVQSNRGLHRERVLYRAFEAAALRLTPFANRSRPLVRRAAEDFMSLKEEDLEALGRLGPLVLVHLGIGALYAGDQDLAGQCFDLADAKHLEAGRIDRVDPLSLRGGLAALQGDLPRARRLLEEADTADWPPAWRASSPADFLNLGLAILALEDGDPGRAETHLAAAGPLLDMVEHWRLFALVRARRDRLAGETEAGLVRLRLLREQRQSAPGTVLAKSFLDIAEAELRLSMGQPDQARDLVARWAKHSAPARVVLARCALALDQPYAAIMQASRVLQEDGVTPRTRLEAETVLACALLRDGQESEARRATRRIMELIRLTGMRAPLCAVPHREAEQFSAGLREAGADDSLVDLVGSEVSSAESGRNPVPTLTGRERAVLQAFTSVQTVDEAAAHLYVSPNTVKSQLKAAHKKLGVSSHQAAITRAAVLGLIEGDALEDSGV